LLSTWMEPDTGMAAMPAPAPAMTTCSMSSVLVAVTARPWIGVVSAVIRRRENRPGEVTLGLLMPESENPFGLRVCWLPLALVASRRMTLSARASAFVAARGTLVGWLGSTMAK